MLTLIIALWIFCAFVSAWLAEQKGYSRASWFLLGALFGVFALLAIGFAPKREVSVAEERQAARDAYFDRKAAREADRGRKS